MPSRDQHLEQARHNEQFLDSFDLGRTPFLGWVVTATFYTALHYLRALMSRHGYTNVSNYGDMDVAFARLSILKRRPDINDDYRSLKDDSWSARYNMWRPQADEVVGMRDGELRRIRDFVLANI